jgi:hypothetical protein
LTIHGVGDAPDYGGRKQKKNGFIFRREGHIDLKELIEKFPRARTSL